MDLASGGPPAVLVVGLGAIGEVPYGRVQKSVGRPDVEDECRVLGFAARYERGVGYFVEWYDFAIYSYSVTIIATLFFPEGNRAAAIVAAFALYGVAFLARPVGRVFCSNLGDRIGRRTTLAVVVSIMGGATMLIGLLPTYGTIGILAPILLAVLCLIQGFSGGGEFTASTSFISEYAPDEKRGSFASISATFSDHLSRVGHGQLHRPCHLPDRGRPASAPRRLLAPLDPRIRLAEGR